MNERYATLVHRLRETVLTSRGVTEPSIRQSIETYAAVVGGRSGSTASVPAALDSYVDTVARHAYRVTDEDVAALKRAGYSEDALFEVTVCTALGAGLGRLERGLAALKGEV